MKSFDSSFEVYSAGTLPTEKVNPYAIKVMNEVGIDLSNNKPKNVNQFLNDDFEYVITVCGGANESCPLFSGKVKQRLHIGIDDPADAKGTEEEIILEFRRIRDLIKTDFYNFYLNIKKNEL